MHICIKVEQIRQKFLLAGSGHGFYSTDEDCDTFVFCAALCDALKRISSTLPIEPWW